MSEALPGLPETAANSLSSIGIQVATLCKNGCGSLKAHTPKRLVIY